VEDRTAGVKSTEEIHEDMLHTRESISEKVAALETQVMGTIQTAADTVTNTVDAVKEAVTNTPAAVSETVKQTMDAVKQGFHDTIGSFSMSGCVEKNPWAALGTSLFAGFVTGFLTGGRSSRPSNFAGRHVATSVEESPRMTAPAAHQGGFLSDMGEMVGKELKQLAEQSMTTLLQSLKRSVGERVPEVVDTAVHRVSDQIQNVARHRTAATTSHNGY